MIIEKELIGLSNFVHTAARRFTYSKQDAEDIAQNVLVRAWKYGSNWKPKNGATLKTWLYRILINEAMDESRRKRRKVKTQEIDKFIAETTIDNDLLNQLKINKSELQQLVIENKHRHNIEIDVLILYYIDQLSYKEISDLLDMPEGTVKSRMHRIIKYIQKHYDIESFQDSFFK
jgi:RNA polymerase sigma-70 factor (ECF subfamily)